MSSLLISALLLGTTTLSVPDATLPLKCQLNETADTFLFYQEQMVYRSEQFAIFHNFKGRVVTQIDLKTGELIRTTYLGQDYQPKYQMLLGQCDKAQNIIDLWMLGQTPFDE